MIDEETVDRAIVLARYYRQHARSVFGLMGELPMQALALRILRWLGARNSRELASLTVRDIHRSRGPGTTSSQVRVALRLLEDHGYVRVERLSAGRGGGRPSERVLVSPQIQNHGTSSDSGARTSVLSPTSDDSGDFRFRPRDARGIPIRPSGSLVTASGAAARATRRTGTANRSRSAADEPHLQGLRQTFLSRLTEVPDKAEMNGVALDLASSSPTRRSNCWSRPSPTECSSAWMWITAPFSRDALLNTQQAGRIGRFTANVARKPTGRRWRRT